MWHLQSLFCVLVFFLWLRLIFWQHVLEHGKPHERSAIVKEFTGQIVQMSLQKFASNVVEKCLTFGSPEERQILVNEMLGSTDKNEPLQVSFIIQVIIWLQYYTVSWIIKFFRYSALHLSTCFISKCWCSMDLYFLLLKKVSDVSHNFLSLATSMYNLFKKSLVGLL